MLNYEKYLDRHGEYGVQAIIERIERIEGIRANATLPLEDRWNLLMQPVQFEQRVAA